MAEAPKTPASQTVRPMTPEEIRLADHAEQARIAAEVAERDATNGPDGGRYKVGDDIVDANGTPVKDKKD